MQERRCDLATQILETARRFYVRSIGHAPDWRRWAWVETAPRGKSCSMEHPRAALDPKPAFIFEEIGRD